MKKIFGVVVVLLIATFNSQAQTKQPPKLIGRTHEYFSLFWKDFKKAIIANDSVKLSTMVHYPFEDANTIYRGDENTLTCINESDFLMNYSTLFPPHVKAAIKANKFRGFNPKFNLESGGDRITKGQYLLTPSTDEHPQYYDYIFGKRKGIYKMVGNAYYQ